MAESFDIVDFELQDDDMARIATLETGHGDIFFHSDPTILKWMAERKRDI